MKRIFLCLVLVSSISNLLAQESDLSDMQMERLERELQTHTRTDTNRVILLNRYAQLCFENANYIEGQSAAEEARSLSENLNFSRGQGYYYRTMSRLAPDLLGLEFAYQIKADWLLNERSEFNNFGTAVGTVEGVSIRSLGDTTILRMIQQLENAIAHFNGEEERQMQLNFRIALAGIFRRWKTLGNSYEISDEIKKYEEHLEEALLLAEALGDTELEIYLMRQKIRDYWLQGLDVKADEIQTKISELVVTISDRKINALVSYSLGGSYTWNNRQLIGLRYLHNAENLLEGMVESNLLIATEYMIGTCYRYLGDRKKAIHYYDKEIALRKQVNFWKGVQFNYWHYIDVMRKLDKESEIPAEVTTQFAVYFDSLEDNAMKGLIVGGQAKYLLKNGQIDSAISMSKKSLVLLKNDLRGTSIQLLDLADAYYELDDIPKALKYANQGYNLAVRTAWIPARIDGADLLTKLYDKNGDREKTIIYLKESKTLREKRDELNNRMQLAEVEIEVMLRENEKRFDELEREKLLSEQESKNQRLILLGAFTALLLVVIIALILYRNNVSRKRTNEVLNKQKTNLESAYSSLKATQSQLIQSEKMASLGELTAGIAHEIQNPLNFVNNFSEVNKELIAEMREEIGKKNYVEVDQIAKDVQDNEEKINHHGKRADAIVKGMLQHSKGSSGQKEPTDINALCDEYLRLSYHGLRAKDKSFNAKFEMDFDASLPKVNVVPQDIGRVVLNLINNAFYAAHVKTQDLASLPYEPTVTVSTKHLSPVGGGKGVVLISVKDNGPGIPEHIKEKIFQPFFTTKPTGQGTGLGLSLSYDIVKAHGGEIKVETELEKGSLFILTIPVSTC